MSTIDCKNKYIDILQNINNLSDFIPICDEILNFETMDDVNKYTYDNTDICYTVLKRANADMYKHTYDINDWFIPLAESMNINRIMIDEIFDLERRENCCNVISIVLYSKNIHNSNKNMYNLNNYLYSMKKSLDNVANCLPDFIVRFYLDKSVFETIYKTYSESNLSDLTKLYLEKSFTILKYIINHPKSEIFIYFCRDIMNHTIELEKVRSFRLLPMTETDVNISISREADGFVSYMDCYNIKQFSKSDTHKMGLFYQYEDDYTGANFLYEFFERKPNSNEVSHYSKWLNLYEQVKSIYNFKQGNINKDCGCIENNIFDHIKYNSMKKKYEKIQLLDILAGLFGIKFKFKKTYFNSTIRKISDKMLILQTKMFSDDTKNISSIIDPSNQLYTYFQTGYDEILLQELFNPLTTYDCSTIDKQSNSIAMIKNIFVLIRYNSNSSILEQELELKKLPSDYYQFIEKMKPITYKLDQFQISNKDKYDLIFLYKIKDMNEESSNLYYGSSIHLLNSLFLNNTIKMYDELYNLLYPPSIMSSSTYNKYLKYKMKYYRLKTNIFACE